MSQGIHKQIMDKKGFTLVEMIMVMALFMGIIIISSQAFNKIITVASQQTKSSESDTQGVIGLEMLRLDLEHAGYGLPWILNFPGDFEEGNAAVGHLAPGIDTEGFNEKNNISSDPNKVPRAILAGTSPTDGRDYLVIKSILAGANDTAKKWAYVEGIGTDSILKVWGSNNFVEGDRVITIDSRTKRLISTSSPSAPIAAADYSYPVPADLKPPATFQPQLDTDVYVTYGVSGSNLTRAPFNRVDYYVKRPATASDMPTRCASGVDGKPGTGILYKAVMSQSNGAFSPEYPLLECVADMQVVFTVAADGINGVDVDQGALTGLTAKEIREQLKAIKIYIVAHEGGKDTGFTYANQTITVGEGNGRVLDLKNDIVGSDDYKNYRWKTYKLVVLPKNINY